MGKTYVERNGFQLKRCGEVVLSRRRGWYEGLAGGVRGERWWPGLGDPEEGLRGECVGGSHRQEGGQHAEAEAGFRVALAQFRAPRTGLGPWHGGDREGTWPC